MSQLAEFLELKISGNSCFGGFLHGEFFSTFSTIVSSFLRDHVCMNLLIQMTDSHPYTFLSNEDYKNSLPDCVTENHSIKLCEVGEMNSFRDLNEDYTESNLDRYSQLCIHVTYRIILHTYIDKNYRVILLPEPLFTHIFIHVYYNCLHGMGLECVAQTHPQNYLRIEPSGEPSGEYTLNKLYNNVLGCVTILHSVWKTIE